jgi:actin-related protein 2
MLWEYGIKKKLNIDPKNERILLTEAALNPQKNREQMCEIFFEKFGFSKLQIGVQALLSLFAEGRMTATLLDSGDGVTHCIPISEGYIQQSHIERMNLAGRHVTSYLTKLLLLRGYAFNSSADFELVREIKEKFCFVSSDIEMDRKLSRDTTTFVEEYRLPDKSLIKIERERFEASEILFQPHLAGFQFPGVSEVVFNCINNCPIDTRKDLYQNILLSGGTTMFPGFPTRLENDIHNLYKKVILKGDKSTKLKFDIEVIDPPRRKYNVFIGAGVYCNASDQAPDWWITKQDWEEAGPQCLKKAQQNVAL